MAKTMAEVLREHQDWTDDYGYKCSCRWQSHTEDAQTHQSAALSAAGFGLVTDAVVIHVAHDTEAHARSFNEGYETAMAQELADDPTTAQDWLEGKLIEAKANALLTAADALDKLWDERKDKPDNGWRDWADGVEEAETLVRELAAKEILP